MRAKIKTSVENERYKAEKSIEERIIDVSKHRFKNSPSLTWKECIKKIWKEDPLIYFRGGLMFVQISSNKVHSRRLLK